MWSMRWDSICQEVPTFAICPLKPFDDELVPITCISLLNAVFWRWSVLRPTFAVALVRIVLWHFLEDIENGKIFSTQFPTPWFASPNENSAYATDVVYAAYTRLDRLNKNAIISDRRDTDKLSRYFLLLNSWPTFCKLILNSFNF